MGKSKILSTIAFAMLCFAPSIMHAYDLPKVYSPNFLLTGMSDNAQYAISSSIGDEDVDNPRGSGGILVDLRDYATKSISAPSGWAEVNDVADNGIVVGSAAGKPGYWSADGGKWTTFDVPAPWGGGCFLAVTPDAHYAVGYYFDAMDEYRAYPMMYDITTGESRQLTNLPIVDLSGIDQHQNLFYGISPDGRYALGQMSQSYLLPVALMSYVYDTVENTWKPIGYDYNASTKKYTPRDPELHFIDNQHMSCDGRWVTGGAYVVRNGGETFGGTEAYYPYRYNIAEDTFEVYSTVNDENILGAQITADGVVLGSTPYGNPYPTAMIRSGNYFITLDQTVQQVFGTRLPEITHDEVSGTFRAISADGLTALMSTYDNSYIITMPDQFAALAAQVDLLANYTVNIPSGSTINRISEVKITFDRAIECIDFASDVKLLDSAGNTVRTALGFALSPTNDHTVVVTFRTTTLTPGEKYTIDIPADKIWIKGDRSVKSKAISISYIGRETGPVKVQNITPASGMAVAQFNSNPDYISITFDTPVAISPNATCGLYNTDENALLASFIGTTEGRTAYFFPTATYQLYKGSNYKVVISEGSVTDLSGGGGCEEIVIEYQGAYVRELSADDIYIFNADCDSYDNFMFYEGDFNNPGTVATSWGFAYDNPWLLLRDSEQSDDWALAAHSMYSPAGWADDWLITPQLFIPDGNTYLAFDAQSYRKSKEDVLKVYIYSDDAVFNYFTDETKATFLAEADLVFDEAIPAGATDEGLDGEWTRYTIPLSKYGGQNIYIAFAYNVYDQSAIFIDDVQVIRNMNFLVTNQTPVAVVNADYATVSGLVTIASELSTFNGMTVRLYDDNNTLLGTQADETVVLTKGDTYKFSFADALKLTPGKETAYRLEVESQADVLSYNYTIKDLTFDAVKRVVLEEYTGSACGNCPLGIQAIENLQRLYPDNFIPVTIRTYMNDVYGIGLTDYSAFLGMNAAPSGRLNRGAILAPMLQNGSKGYEFFGRGIITSDGTEAHLWADEVQDLLNVPADAAVEFTVNYNEETGSISIPCEVEFALDRTRANIGLFAVVLENNLPTYQLNYFTGINDANLGPWGLGGIYDSSTVTSWLAQDVARFVVNGSSFNGSSFLQSNFTAGNTYRLTLSANIPQGRLLNPANCHVVVMIIDRSTGGIINANIGKLTTSGITDIESETEAEAEYYTLTGIKVTEPEKGNIYIKIVDGKATKVKF